MIGYDICNIMQYPIHIIYLNISQWFSHDPITCWSIHSFSQNLTDQTSHQEVQNSLPLLLMSESGQVKFLQLPFCRRKTCLFFFNRSKYQQKYLPEGMMRKFKHSTVTLHTILFQQSTFNVGMMPRTNYYRLGWTRHVLGCLHASPFSSQHCQAL